MTYKSYPVKADTENRMTRKRARQTVFMFNRKAAKLRRKEARLARNENRREESAE